MMGAHPGRAPAGRAAPTLREWLREAPVGLSLSSGFFGFFAHCGLLTVFEDEGIVPARLSGSSAGALVGGLYAAGLSAQNLGKVLLSLERRDFWDPALGAGLLRGKLFRARLDALLPARTFSTCRVPLALSVCDVLSRTTRVVDHGDLASAIHASCAVPLLFHPVWRDGRPLVDGGVLDRPGLQGMPTGGPVLFHHLASRSPWRRRGGAAMAIPRRPGMQTLILDGLPRVGPFRLPEGARAFEGARSATLRALSQPLRGELLRVAA